MTIFNLSVLLIANTVALVQVMTQLIPPTNYDKVYFFFIGINNLICYITVITQSFEWFTICLILIWQRDKTMNDTMKWIEKIGTQKLR